MAEKFIFEFNERGLDQILQKVAAFRQTIREVGQAGDLGDGFQRFFNQFIAGTRNSTKGLRDLHSQIRQIEQQLQSSRFTSELETLQQGLADLANLQRSSGKLPFADLVPDLPEAGPRARGAEGLEQLAAQRAAERLAIEAEIARRVAEAAALREQGDRLAAKGLEEALRLERMLVAESQRLTEERQRQATLAEREANIAQYTNRLDSERAALLERLRDVSPRGGGGRANELVIQRVNNLLAAQKDLREQLNEEIARFHDQVPQEADQTLQKETQLSQQLHKLTEQRLELEEKLGAARKEAREAGLGQPGRFVGGSEEEQAAVAERQAQAKRAQLSIAEKLMAVNTAIANAEVQRAANLERMARIESGGTGLSRGASEVLSRLRQIDELLAEITTSTDAFGDFFGPEVHDQIEQLVQSLAAFDDTDVELLSPEEQQSLADANLRARELLSTIEDFPTEGIPMRLNEEELMAQIPALHRLFLGAARDFGRRFTATLQFAVSSALLFGTQKLIRNFIDAAIEVERTFADISSALEFNIDAERGTAAFERVLERVRRQTLQIADDFNALPTEVNSAAYQMVARFQDIDAAMTATRAQVLATRVATINQEEALRSLTGVAEAYGVALAGISDSTTRQRLQADLYASSLDKATAIQQQFGSSVEDILDGAGGVAELFRSLGFSIDETFAIVAATTQRTSQSGAQVADRLGRAFSSIETAGVREELLALANEFDSFFLRPIDFYEGGREVFFAIADQFADLDQALQNRISQIIGQRRETAFVSALLAAASEGTVDTLIGVSEDAAGAAEDRLGHLLATVSGTVEGISSEFQALAQNLTQLGFLTPIKLLLSGLEAVLKLLNLIVTGALNFIEVLNRVRLPFLDAGLGDALTTMIALVTAALSLKSVIDSMKFVAGTKAAGSAVNVIKGALGIGGAGGTAGKVGLGIGGFLGISGLAGEIGKADGAARKFATGIKTLLIAPFTTMLGLFNRAKIALSTWMTALVTGTVVTGGATTSEVALQIVRLRTAAINGILILKELGVVGVLTRIGQAFVALIPKLASGAQGLLAMGGAFVAFRAGLGIVSSILETIFGTDTGTGTLEREKEIVLEAEASGKPITQAEARVQALTERMDALGNQLSDGSSRLEADLRSFGAIFLGPVVELFGGTENLKGTTENIQREERRASLQAAHAEAALLVEEMVRLNAALGGTGDEMVPILKQYQSWIQTAVNALNEVDTDTGDPTSQAAEMSKIDAVRILLDQVATAFEEEIPELLTQWGEVLTAAQIQAAISRLQSQIQLGFRTVGQARRELQGLQRNAEEGLAQAIRGGDPVAIEEAERTLLDIALQDQQWFENERDLRIQRNSLIEDNRAQTLANLETLRDHARRAANNPNFGPQAVLKAQQDVAAAERAYNKAIEEEAIARAEFNVSSARTFSDRIKALQQLLEAIKAQIAARIQATAEALIPDLGGGVVGNIVEAAAAAVAVASGVVSSTAAEDARLLAVLEQIYDARLRQATLIARNSTLKNKSSLDEVAAIAATVNALRAELEFMRNRGDEYQEILAKEIELQNAIANQRMAEANRRAAFYRLTAGTGDQIKAAQAELRAAQDRLDTIVALGGAETQQGYEAELAVLQARHALVQIALRYSDLSRRVGSDLTDGYAQALLDVHAAQEALGKATGDLEKLEAEKSLAEAEARAQREFYDQKIADLDFLYQTDQIGRSQYIAGLRALQAGIDRTTRQGEELWRQIEIQIQGLMDSANQAFNIPTEIRLPTLFEIRRALAADALGVNYQDMRTQEINVYVSDDVDVNAVITALESTFGGSIDLEAARLSSGAAGITIGGFN